MKKDKWIDYLTVLSMSLGMLIGLTLLVSGFLGIKPEYLEFVPTWLQGARVVMQPPLIALILGLAVTVGCGWLLIDLLRAMAKR